MCVRGGSEVQVMHTTTSSDPTIAIVPARCGQTSLQRLDFDIVLEEERSGLWYLIGTTTIGGGAGSKAGLESLELRGTFDTHETYPGCPHCANKGIFQCGNCYRICCWDGHHNNVTCRWCGYIQTLDQPIHMISGSSAPEQKTQPISSGGRPPAHAEQTTYRAYRAPRKPHISSVTDEIRPLAGHDGPVWCVAWSADSQLLASGGKDGTVHLWNIRDGTQRLVIAAHAGGVRTIALRSDDHRLFSGGVDGAVAGWDTRTGQSLWSAHKHSGVVFGLSIAPNGHSLITGAKDGTLCLWQGINGHLIHQITAHSGWVWTVAWSPGGEPIASGSLDGTVCCWRSENPHTITRFNLKTDKIRSVAFHPDGHHLAIGCYDRTVRILNVTTGKETLVLRGHAGTVRTVAFHPDGTLLASAGSDHIVRVYDIKTGHEHRRLSVPGIVYGIAFSPDGQRLAVGSGDGLVRLWRGDQWR